MSAWRVSIRSKLTDAVGYRGDCDGRLPPVACRPGGDAPWRLCWRCYGVAAARSRGWPARRQSLRSRPPSRCSTASSVTTCTWSSRPLARVSATDVITRRWPCWPRHCPAPWRQPLGRSGSPSPDAWRSVGCPSGRALPPRGGPDRTVCRRQSGVPISGPAPYGVVSKPKRKAYIHGCQDPSVGVHPHRGVASAGWLPAGGGVVGPPVAPFRPG
jgi:hypothetical protein